MARLVALLTTCSLVACASEIHEAAEAGGQRGGSGGTPSDDAGNAGASRGGGGSSAVASGAGGAGTGGAAARGGSGGAPGGGAPGGGTPGGGTTSAAGGAAEGGQSVVAGAAGSGGDGGSDGNGGCEVSNALAMPAMNAVITVPVDACLKIELTADQQTWVHSITVQPSAGTYPFAFTWSNCLTAGDGAFSANYGNQVLSPIDGSCAVLIKLAGPGQTIEVQWWGS